MYNEIHLSNYLSDIRNILLKTKYHQRYYEEATFTPLFSILLESSDFNMDSFYQQKSVRTGNKPDFTIYNDNKIIGCIECKNLRKNLDDEDCQSQINKYSKEYVNVILTNFIEFRLYQNLNLVRTMRFDNLERPSYININDFNDIISNFYKYGISISRKILSKDENLQADITKHALDITLWEILSLFIGFFIPIIFKNIFYILFNIKQPIYQLISEIAVLMIIIFVLFNLKNKKWSKSIKIQNFSLKFSEIWIIVGTSLGLILTGIFIWGHGYYKLLSPSIDNHFNPGIKSALDIITIVIVIIIVIVIGNLIYKKNNE